MTEIFPYYCWIVICKNSRYHRRQNLFYGHKILLGETDAYSRTAESRRPV